MNYLMNESFKCFNVTFTGLYHFSVENKHDSDDFYECGTNGPTDKLTDQQTKPILEMQ